MAQDIKSEIFMEEAMEEFPSYATEEEKGKHYCQDLTEGKFTVPIIHAAQQKGGEAVLNILRQRTTDILVNLKKYCVSLLEELGSMQYTREMIHHPQCSIQDEINNLGGNLELSKIIDEMSTLALEEWPSTPVEDAMKSQYYCEDLTEGKFTLPIIHAAKQKGGEAVLDILREHTKDISVKKHCLSLLEELGSMQYTRDRLRRLECSIRDQIYKFGGNPDLLSVLDEMASAI